MTNYVERIKESQLELTLMTEFYSSLDSSLDIILITRIITFHYSSRIPYNLALTGIGLGIGMLSNLYPAAFRSFVLTNSYAPMGKLTLFMPILIFNSAFDLKIQSFKMNFVQV